MPIPREWIEFANDLEAYLEERLEAEDIREKYGKKPPSADIQEIMDNVEHFLTDSNLRENNRDYRKMQEGEMVKLIFLLRTGRPMKEIRRITFQAKSDIHL